MNDDDMSKTTGMLIIGLMMGLIVVAYLITVAMIGAAGDNRGQHDDWRLDHVAVGLLIVGIMVGLVVVAVLIAVVAISGGVP